MSVGRGPGGRYNLSWLKQHDVDRIQRTTIHLLTPYGIPGLSLIDQVTTPDARWSITANSKVLPPQALEPHLQDTRLEIDEDGFVSAVISKNVRGNAPKQKLVHLEPDRWGRSWISEVWLRADRYIGPAELDETPNNFHQTANDILKPACKVLNRILDALAYANGPADLPHLQPEDFWALKVSYADAERRRGSIEIDHLHTLWWRGPSAPDKEILERANALLAAESEPPLFESLLVSARRKKALGDYRGSIIDSISAVESVLTSVLHERLVKDGVSKNKRKDFLGANGPSLSQRVHVMIPTLFDPEEISKTLRNQFKAASTKRNKIVHEGASASQQEAEQHYDTCHKLAEKLTSLDTTESDSSD